MSSKSLKKVKNNICLGILAHVDARKDDIVGKYALYKRKYPENGTGGS